MKLIITTLSFLFICQFGFSQWVEISAEEMKETFAQIDSNFIKKEPFRMDLSTTWYYGHESNEVDKELTGYLIRKNELIFGEANGIKTVQNSEYRLIITPGKKTVKITDKRNQAPAVPMGRNLKRATKIEKQEENGIVTYRVNMEEGSKYSKFEILIGKMGLAEKVTYYFSRKKERTNEKGEKETYLPRMEFCFKNITPHKFSAEDVATEKFIVQKDGDWVGTGTCKDYRVVDIRVRVD